MKHLCKTFPHYATVDILKEFLLGGTYMAMKAIRCEPHFLRCLPVTSIAAHTEDSIDDKRGGGVLRQSSLVDDFRRITDSPKKGATRFNFDTISVLTPLSPASFNPGVINTQSPVRRKLDQIMQKVFGPSQNNEAPSIGSRTSTSDEDEEIIIRQRVTEALAEHFTASLPRETKLKCVTRAKEYSTCQSQQVAHLWGILEEATELNTLLDVHGAISLHQTSIRSHTQARTESTSSFLSQIDVDLTGPRGSETEAHGDGTAPKEATTGPSGTPPRVLTIKEKSESVFPLLENFYCALEELRFPCPPGVYNKFAILGFHVLPRNLFIQYLERGIFRMSENVVRYIASHLNSIDPTPEERHFKYLLACKMKNRNTATTILGEHQENKALIADVSVASFLKDVDDSSDDEEPEAPSTVASFLRVISLDNEKPSESESGNDEEYFVDQHQFLPMNVFLQYLQTQEYKINECRYVAQAYASRFQIPTSNNTS
eukprot:NODE_232_length_1847_cov_100.220930_g207_i0.p1 GENE.NODE_232_length_1847_cov_100.220930_g207_i0~~NODE_232_length_1847_cov_100.220930_g207_i0.p1  ORF type:complete len:486 (+),score=67.87 NODE_232_length_1847_cov_100.220930_g207_i0:329-1786(+)